MLQMSWKKVHEGLGDWWYSPDSLRMRQNREELEMKIRNPLTITIKSPLAAKVVLIAAVFGKAV